MSLALLVLLACGLDRLLGDPLWSPHPVQVMGAAITGLRRAVEAWAGDAPRRLRLGGLLLTQLVVGASGLAGWGLEVLARRIPAVGVPLLVLGLASALAGGSLGRAVRAVLVALPDLPLARARLARIVGRQVSHLPEAEILRAAAETAAENAVDGLFAPLFWMLAGAALLSLGPAPPASPLPGPLALAWGFKAASTLDSMLGYRHGRLRWLGTAGARLDDLLTWLPTRLVALSLPLAAGRPGRTLHWLRAALRDGAPDPSPNAGVSEAAFAHAAGVRLGGANAYADGVRIKPILAAAGRPPDRAGVERILTLGDRLELLWLLLTLPALALLGAGWPPG
ncbi:adenosylcobinamide-phosphate synthase CbiB [Cyanobium sp. Lug-B]|uniref:adenosylcobinamide-phosphate synthase CbiB n=1 Tax=Cyanobium sp. Lug-B TaxID=2823716 RepID=UPI0020CD728B|nr:adenosylcobinamide-phosphate synthase CbiB [Cyanobium sp. Lug-B]MCP9798632.1 cobalamin biosynthesis protein CobD [Cyanobium sp. Lug-B]